MVKVNGTSKMLQFMKENSNSTYFMDQEPWLGKMENPIKANIKKEFFMVKEN